MLDIRYESNAGVSVALNSGVYIGKPNDIFSREWDYKLGYRALATASRGARKVSFKAFFANMVQADAFRRCADTDMQKGTPGTIHVNGWFQRCFVVASEVDCIGDDFFATELTLVLLDGVWRRGVTTAFVSVQSSADYEFLDLPHDLPYDLGATPPRQYTINPGYSGSPAKFVVYGPAVNPSVRLAGNLYQVDVTVPDGGYMVIDPLRRTVTVVAADGTTMDAFSKAHRGSGEGSGEYIFERVPVGTSEISWDNSFGFDLTLYEEEGEPAWS
jgi:hypothetical protein